MAVEELLRCVVCCIVLFGCSVAASVFVDTVRRRSYTFVDIFDLPGLSSSSYEDPILYVDSLGMTIGSTWLNSFLFTTLLSTSDCIQLDIGRYGLLYGFHCFISFIEYIVGCILSVSRLDTSIYLSDNVVYMTIMSKQSVTALTAVRNPVGETVTLPT